MSFHTTQYDLNSASCFFTQCVSDKFPYYIVRFKQGDGGTRKNNSKKFPYYIVRFKLLKYFITIIVRTEFPYYIVRFKQNDKKIIEIMWKCFHTTQYDLNKKSASSHVAPQICFHTTQYDLNCSVGWSLNHTWMVSILHSTI